MAARRHCNGRKGLERIEKIVEPLPPGVLAFPLFEARL